MKFDEPCNLAAYFLTRNVTLRPDKVAVQYRDEQYTYRQINHAACRAANAMRDSSVRQEDRVLIILPDSPAFVAAIMGIHKLGAVLAMVNPRLPTDDLAYYFNYTKAPLAIIHESVAGAIAAMRPGLKYLKTAFIVQDQVPLVCDNTPTQASPAIAAPKSAPAAHATAAFPLWHDVLAQSSPRFEDAHVHPNDPAVWLFTSGTSGKPKAAMHLAHDFIYNTEHYARQVLHTAESDRTLSVAKLFFGYATGTNLWFPFAAGGTTCLFDEHPTPDVMFEKIAAFRPTFLTTVPTMMQKMLQSPLAERADLSCLRVGVSAGEKLPAEVYARWIERFGVQILDGIGSAEMFHIYISNYLNDVKVGSLGRLVPGYDARIVDGDGGDVPAGEIGTLWIKGDSMMTGYYQDRATSSDRLRGEWLNTCDMFRRDDQGYFWYEGRADDLLKVGGIFVSPGEIENCLLQHAAVAECAVIGAEDEGQLVRPKAFVVVRAGHTAGEPLTSELIEFAKARMARYKAPRWVVYMDALPRNDRGKVERKKLADVR